MATFIAGNKIVFGVGFSSYEGSYCDAHITQNSDYCQQQPTMPANPGSGLESGEKTASIFKTDDSELSLRIYPNPTTGQFTIDFMGDETTADIMVLNFQGNRVSKTRCDNQTSADIDISHLSKGMYIIFIKTTENVITRKILRAN